MTADTCGERSAHAFSSPIQYLVTDPGVKSRFVGRFACPVLMALMLSACFAQSNKPSKEFYTWNGLEPDKWASAWLINRYISPVSKITIVPVGAKLNGATAFDIPEAVYRRRHGLSTYEGLLHAYGLENDPVLARIGAIINHIEVSPWTTPDGEDVVVVESRYRDLQIQFARTQVPDHCYSGFFDRLYGLLESTPSAPDVASLDAGLEATSVCRDRIEPIAKQLQPTVLEYPINNLLEMLKNGKKVVFVDTREAAEYDEFHIPGAVNVRLRDVNPETAALFAGADLVISYCIKDFRGYEVAQALHGVGVHPVGIMNPYGLKGWKDLGLPVAGREAVSDEAALGALRECVQQNECAEKNGSS